LGTRFEPGLDRVVRFEGSSICAHACLRFCMGRIP
jgi:hypothetical protein